MYSKKTKGQLHHTATRAKSLMLSGKCQQPCSSLGDQKKSTSLLKSLHWLLQEDNLKSSYWFSKQSMDLRRNTSDVYSPSGSLMSSGLLVVPRVRTETYGEAAISVYGPRLWNSLLEELRTSESVNTFKINLKTSLFSSAFY